MTKIHGTAGLDNSAVAFPGWIAIQQKIPLTMKSSKWEKYVMQKAFHRSLLLYKGSIEMMQNQECSLYDDPSGLVKIEALPVPGVRPVFFLAASSTFSCSMFLT
jgi:hypothetical protein